MKVTKKPVLCAASGEPFCLAGTQSYRELIAVTKEMVRHADGRETLGSAISPHRLTITGSHVQFETQSDRGHKQVTKEIFGRADGGETLGSAISPYRQMIHRGHFNVIEEIVRRAATGESFDSAINVVTAFPSTIEPLPKTRCRPEHKAHEAI